MSATCERLTEFADGRLAPAEADAFRDHLAGCARCQEALHDALQLSAIGAELRRDGIDDLRAARRRRFGWRGYALAALAAAAAAAAAWVLIGRPRRPAEPAPTFFALAEHRGIEARLAYPAADRYRVYSVPREAGGAAEKLELTRLAELERRHDLEGIGAAFLLARDTSTAEGYLERAGDSPSVRVDRAAAALERGDPARALALSDGVLAASPRHPQALWNRALALRDLGLGLAAADAFTQVAALGEPGWAEEASRRAGEARRDVEDRSRGWEDARRACAALVADGTPLPLETARAYPGLARLNFYDAVRAAPSRERVLALAPLAGELDTIYGGDALSRAVARAADADWARRAPLAAAYVELAAGKQPRDAAARDALLARFQAAEEPDLLMGALVLTGQTSARLEAYARMAEATGDPWFGLIAATERAKKEAAAGQLAAAERDYAAALARCDRERLPYRCALLELNLGYLYQQLHRPDDARRVALSGLRRAVTGREARTEVLFLQLLADAARLAQDFPSMRAYHQEALLRQPDNCRLRRDAHEAMAQAFVFALRPDEARRELEAAPRCDLPITLLRAASVAELARRDGTPAEAAALRADLAALRASGALSPGAAAHSLAIEGRLVLARDPDEGTRLLRQAIAAADKIPGDTDGEKARLYAFRSLLSEAGRRGDYPGALALFAEEAGIPAPPGCVLAAMVDDERTLVVARGIDGKLEGAFHDHRATPAVDAGALVPPDLALDVATCPRVDVLAMPPLQGHAGLLPPSVAWSYRAGPPREAAAGAPRRLVVSRVIASPELGLPPLDDWPGASTPATVQLSGADATPERVAAEMADATEIELHTHGVVDRGSDASALILSPDAAGRIALSAREVAGLSLRRAPLVILGACHAAATAPYLHQSWSLPAAFIRAGARAVLAPATPVPDDEARAFFDAVLARIRAGADPAAALRDERMSRLASDPASWTRDVLLFE